MPNDTIEEVLREWDDAALVRKDYNTRRAYARCAADIRFVLRDRPLEAVARSPKAYVITGNEREYLYLLDLLGNDRHAFPRVDENRLQGTPRHIPVFVYGRWFDVPEMRKAVDVARACGHHILQIGDYR